MAANVTVEVLGTMKTANPKIPVAEAADIAMPDGSRLDETVVFMRQEASDAAAETRKDIDELGKSLSETNTKINKLDVTPPVLPGAETIEPEKYYEFGPVDSLTVTLKEMQDNRAYEYAFEFVPAEDFQGLTITPAPVWMREPQYPAGKRCSVSIVRGMAVMGSG